MNELSFEHEVLEAAVPVLIDFSSRWCGPCKVAAPIMAELAARHRGALKVVAVDGDECPELVARFGVRGYPTFVGMARGRVLEQRAGFAGRRALEQLAAALVETSA